MKLPGQNLLGELPFISLDALGLTLYYSRRQYGEIGFKRKNSPQLFLKGTGKPVMNFLMGSWLLYGG